MNQGEQIMTLFVYDIHDKYFNNRKYKSHEIYSNVRYVKIQDFLFDTINSENAPFIFSVIIEPSGARYFDTGLYTFMETVLKRKFMYYTVLRDCFTRQQSLFRYLNSKESKHENTHGLINYKTFKEYILSNQCEDSWLIRSLTKKQSTKLTEADLNKAYIILDNFLIRSITEIDSLINHVFTACYALSQRDVGELPQRLHHRSENKESCIIFEELDEKTQDVFLERTKYDRQIFKKYINA
jgi:hypothetical protein